MTKLPEIITLTAANTSTTEVICLYCGSNNCGSLYGDPVCHELPTPTDKDMVGFPVE